MNKVILLLTFTFAFHFVNAQNISLDEAISLRTKSLAHVEEYLTARKWQFTNSTEPGVQSLGTASFAYKKNYYDDKANSFITYGFNNYLNSKNRINIQINSISTYNSFLNRVKILGYKLVSSEIEDGKIVKLYRKGALTIEVSASTQDGDFSTVTTYHFFICDTQDYNNLKGINDEPEIDVNNQLGNDAMERGDYETAISFYQANIKSGKADYTDYYNTGLCYIYLKKYLSAISYLKKAEEKNKQDIDTKRMLAHTYFELKDNNSAIAYQKLVLANKDSDSDDYSELGRYLLFAKLYSEGLKYLKQAEEADDTNLRTKARIAHIYLLTGKLEEAKTIYLQYKDEIVDSEDTWYSLIQTDFDLLKERGFTSSRFEEIMELIR